MKGALRIFKPKQLSYLSGIPVETLKEWKGELIRGDVSVDETVAHDIKAALLGQFMKSSTR
jgi:hypothetical protein